MMGSKREIRFRKKGQVGVGTLIVFIAMILVAAIAAAVLVRTAGNLQSKALLTGERSKAQVSTSVDTVLLTGSNGSNQNIEDFKHVMRLVPGSDGIKFSTSTLKIEVGSVTADLAYGNGGCTVDATQNNNGTAGFWTNTSQSTDGFFTVQYIEQGSSFVNGFFQRGDLVRLCYASPISIAQDTDVVVSFIPAVGNIHVIEMATPNLITRETVRLYP